ncbi:hypothetical protein ACER0A_002145 [Haloimpatiens sp. FM7315]|uniref:hypothetical protein n=1 Tax=Haloimpatiens sp. FM7315 TaxID=3298609 RepID=UPI0035A2C85E
MRNFAKSKFSEVDMQGVHSKLWETKKGGIGFYIFYNIFKNQEGDSVSKKYKFNTRWNKSILKCACLFGNPACDRYRKCEVLELTLEPYADIEKCMN